MLAKLILLSLVSFLTLACGASASPTPGPTVVPPATPTRAPTDTPPATPTVANTPAPSLASRYDVDESRFYTIKQLGDVYTKAARGEGPKLTRQSIHIEGCHTGETVSINRSLWVAFSGDGDLDLKDNVVLVAGFDSLPLPGICYDMVVSYKGTGRVSLSTQSSSAGYRSRDVSLQQFRLVDGEAIQTQR